jgi:hypothetical protein
MDRFRARAFPALLLLLAALAPRSAPCGEERILRLSGTPEAIGREHGRRARDAIRIMIDEYVGDAVVDGRLRPETTARIATMREALPDWYLAELAACADAAGVDRNVLLYAQCEGDIDSLPGCTTYVAFGPATADGGVQMGRNFDYWGLDSTATCVRTFAVRPSDAAHHAFVSVGWAGILGGWTFYNEKGLFVANNLGGGAAKNPRGVPTLVLERMIAQQAATVDEAIALIRRTPRMRGQAIVLGHAGNPARDIAPSAALVEYDAETVKVTRPKNGFLYHTSVGTDGASLQRAVKTASAHPYDAIRSAGGGITLHSVAIDPVGGRMWVAHGRPRNAHEGEYVPLDLGPLLRGADAGPPPGR